MYIAETFFTAVPGGEREEKELAVYRRLEELGIPYQGLDHDRADTMEICELIMHILSMLTFYYVVEGIKELCAPLGRNDIVQLANKVAIIYFIGMAAATAIDFFTGDAANFGAIISTIGLILSIVADFMYVSLLGKAADALETA